MIALILGGARCLIDDLKAWDALGVSADLIIGVNDALYTFPNLDAMATLHPEHVPDWRRMRADRGWPEVPVYSFHRPECGLTVWNDYEKRLEPIWVGGSSGLYAVGVALHVFHAKAIFVGTPMDETPNRYRDEKRWRQVQRYWRRWEQAKKLGLLDDARSMSGNTRNLLGAPNAEWLNAKRMAA